MGAPILLVVDQGGAGVASAVGEGAVAVAVQIVHEYLSDGD